MNAIPTLPSDRQLTDAVRTGSDAAWNELMERHGPAVRRIRPSRRHRTLVEERLAVLRSELERGVPADEGVPAIRAFRPRAIASVTGGSYGPRPHVHGDEPLLTGTDRASLLALAFATLPEPWQSVLWYAHVDGLSAAEIAPLVGRTIDDVVELLGTAHRGLTDAFLVEYLDVAAFDDENRRVVSLLGGHLRGVLPPKDQRLVDEHLLTPRRDVLAGEDELADAGVHPHDAGDTRRLIDFLAELDRHLPAAIAPGITGVAPGASRLGATAGAARVEHRRRVAVLGAAAAVVVALVAAAVMIRRPFDNDVISSAPGTDVSSPVLGEPDTGDAGDPSSSTTAPEPTLPDLRPEGDGLHNELDIVVADETQAVGFVASPSEVLTIEVTVPGPVVAGATGTVDLAVANPTDSVVETAVRLFVPRGVVFDRLVDGDAECSDPDDDAPFCNVTVPARGAIELSVRFSLQSSVVGTLDVDGDQVVSPIAAPIHAVRAVEHSSVGHGGIAVIGNSLMTCDDEPALDLGIDCDAVRDGVGDTVNRWDVPMRFVGTALQFGVANSSSAELVLPEGATVEAAFLYWSGDLDERQVTIPDDGSNETVTLLDPNGEVATVVADQLRLGDLDATQYLGSADVTELVAAGGPGSYLIGNVQSVEVQGSYAGWSMVVVYDDDSAPRRERLVVRPFDWIAPEPRFESELSLPVPVAEGAAATMSVIAFEGERGFRPETLEVGGEVVGGDAAFDSTITGPREPSYVNNLGVELDAYDLSIDSDDGTLPLRLTSEQDGIRLAVVTLAVDVDR